MVPAIEDLDSMSLEQITELREKIRKKVEKAQEEEMVSQAKQQEQDDDYEYMWEEADPEEEEAKKVDEIIQGTHYFINIISSLNRGQTGSEKRKQL